MKVHFEATIDDQVDVALRSLQGSKSLAVQRRATWVLLPIALGLLTFTMTRGFDSLTRSLLGVFAALAGAIAYPIVSSRLTNRRIHGLVEEQLGEIRRFRVDVELKESGLTFKQLGVELTLDWSNVEAVEDLNDRVDFRLKGGGISTVRSRAFESPQHQREFVELAAQFIGGSADRR